jgi:2-C-methyl-D-erythritol 4-phosphate cytidylyltransferase
MEHFVIIVAGGIGTRMKSDRPKQFIDLLGTPIIVRTIRCFLDAIPDIRVIVCVHRNYRGHLDGLIEKHGLGAAGIQVTLGGETRFESVRNGLALITNSTGIVAIHDAARPLVSSQTIQSCFDTAATRGNAVPYIKVNESLRKISNNVNHAVNRHEYRIIQTPQCFQVGAIRRAFSLAQGNSFTDDASVLEAAGETVNLVEGNEENIKITSPHDLLIAQAILSRYEQRSHPARP